MGFVGGAQHARFVEKIGDAERDRLLAAPIDVGKHTAAALVCDFWGEIVAPPFGFALNEGGFTKLRSVLARAEAKREASWVRVGVEQAGHYHDTLVARLQDAGLDVALLNPAQVKENRNQDLLRTLKSDARDLCAMAELLIRGKGRKPASRTARWRARWCWPRIASARSRHERRSSARCCPPSTSSSRASTGASRTCSTPRSAAFYSQRR